MYLTESGTGSYAGKHRLLTLCELGNSVKINIVGTQSAEFTDDSKYIVFKQGKDSLCLISLSDQKREYISKVNAFELFTKDGHQWLICRRNSESNELVLRNLTNGKMQQFANVSSYVLSPDKRCMLIMSQPNSAGHRKMTWINLGNNENKAIKDGTDAISIISDVRGEQWAFLANDAVGRQSIWIYNSRTNDAKSLVNTSTNGMPPDMELAGLSNFSKDGKRLFFTIKDKPAPKPNHGIVKVNIWSYTDAKKQPQQLEESSGTTTYLAVIDLSNSGNIRRLQQRDEVIADRNDDYVLINYPTGNLMETYWNYKAISQTFILSTTSEVKKSLPLSGAILSIGGKYVIGFGPGISHRDCMAYDIEQGVKRNLTEKLPIPLREDDKFLPEIYQNRGLRPIGWLSKDSSLLIQDDYDLWLLDPSGQKKAVNLTNGRVAGWQYQLAYDNGKQPITGNTILLHSFNKKTKQSGFTAIKSWGDKKPQLLYQSNALFEQFGGIGYGYYLKARDTSVYLVKRENCDSSPNLYQTNDFKTFKSVSNIHPETKFNWMKSELLNVKLKYGKSTQVVLYKPEDFDVKKKYPVIFHYYQAGESDKLNSYRHPVDDLDIPWFVSHGYLVAVIDIHNEKGYPGKSALITIKAAAKYLVKFSYVDKLHLGLQGHSYGGYETNYIITHSKLFAAAVSSAGVSDITAVFPSQEFLTEGYQYYMGSTPWLRPDLYTENSPIYAVEKITTPVLMMANPGDHNVPQTQGIEFFTALRRAGKRAWMLEYDTGGHGPFMNGSGFDNYKDFLRRQFQFFDHYLKGAPAPIWMTRGIPASQKGQTDGFEYDTVIKTPGPGLVYDPLAKAKKTKTQ